MKLLTILFTLSLLLAPARAAEIPSTQPAPKFKALAFYSLTVEKDHVAFAKDAIAFYTNLAKEKNFTFDTTLNWKDLNTQNLKNYDLIIWLDDFPHSDQQKKDFETYMEHGGAWLGHHVAAYNDKSTRWPWFLQFIGGAVFYANNWPPTPAKLTVDTLNSPITKNLPASYLSPANEFYQWVPSPRLNKDVVVLLTLDPANFPLGKKDLLTNGDVPVVWSNTKYKMLYINMGHGNKILSDPTQNQLFTNAILWLGDKSAPKLPPKK